MAQAVSFVRSHSSVVLVTLDLGFNNLLPCLVNHRVNETCVSQSLATLRQQLTQILAALRAASASLRIVGVGHYDPYLHAHIHSFAVPSFASASLSVIDRLNAVLRVVYSTAEVPIANVGSAFALTQAVPTTLSPGTTVPKDLVRLCALTWACDSPPLGNSHPNEDGYEVIAEAIADVVRT